MLAPQNQDLRQILIHLPCLAVRCPVLRELIGVPYFSGLTANLLPQNGYFCKQIGSCVYISPYSPIPPTPKIPPDGLSPWPWQHKKRPTITISQNHTHFAIWSRTNAPTKSIRPSKSYSQVLSNYWFSLSNESVLLVCKIAYQLVRSVLGHFRIKFDK